MSKYSDPHDHINACNLVVRSARTIIQQLEAHQADAVWIQEAIPQAEETATAEQIEAFHIKANDLARNPLWFDTTGDATYARAFTKAYGQIYPRWKNPEIREQLEERKAAFEGRLESLRRSFAEIRGLARELDSLVDLLPLDEFWEHDGPASLCSAGTIKCLQELADKAEVEKQLAMRGEEQDLKAPPTGKSQRGRSTAKTNGESTTTRDRRIYERMESVRDRATVAREFGITVEEIKQAQDRHRKRQG